MLITDETLLCLAQNILVQQLNHAATYLNSACQHHAEITQLHTSAALIGLSTTTRNLPTSNTSEISNIRKNAAYWLINTSGLSSYIRRKFPDVQSHGRQTSTDPVFTEKNPR